MKYMMKSAIVAVFLLTLGATSWAQEASSVRVTQSDGTVEIRKGDAGSWKPVREGDVLGRGDRLSAKSKSAAVIQWSNGSMVKIYPNTEIVLTGVVFDLEKKLEMTILDLVNGRMFVKAQVPEHLFAEFMVRMGAHEMRAQAAEFAIKYDPAKGSYKAWSLFGRLVADDGTGTGTIRIDGGFAGTVGAGGGSSKGGIAPLSDKIKRSLTKVSKQLGGSLLFEEEETASTGGKLRVKIGGVTNRRGSFPYTVNFKALINGGSGKIKSLEWEFGDGESATTRKVEHTFTQGLYVVVLRVEDENGDKASAQIGISVEEECNC